MHVTVLNRHMHSIDVQKLAQYQCQYRPQTSVTSQKLDYSACDGFVLSVYE
jgi:hypothetical protein